MVGAAGIFAAGRLASPGCGGEVSPYIDEAGVYRAADGAVIFVPAGACTGWDASHLDDPAPACTVGDAPICVSWYAGVTPPGYPVDTSGCEGDPGSTDGSAHCAQLTSDAGDFPICPELGPVGDLFCQAWGQQFVINGRGLSTCVEFFSGELRCSLFGIADELICVDGNENATGVYVATDAGSVCKRPCQQ
jgi:hypothetical protein